MSHPDDFTLEWSEPLDRSITDVRVTRGTALYRLPRWQRWLMPWRHFKVWRKPMAPFPDA
jgi:hypothetical protein